MGVIGGGGGVEPYNPEICLYKPWRPKGFFNLKSTSMSYLALSDSFEYLCYGSAALIQISILLAR